MSPHRERLADVVAATVEVAGESGQAGSFTDEVAAALTSVIGKLADKAVDAAELSGFVSGWQEAVDALRDTGDSTTAGAQVYRMPGWATPDGSAGAKDV
ncbi:hypothetical protein [Streptomyces caatingaensis]|uniref:Uncharacterized protein n=1 Tax=Streptomyces caatingaensis TaxID=1678637 RepID=A0A0K9X9L1_9ACTN|nr:hypothetical protein [Streptomyces caatingaensis]KNB50115.1 hypothetical protein AC230_25795 [Streptomyces caatingaensis]